MEGIEIARLLGTRHPMGPCDVNVMKTFRARTDEGCAVPSNLSFDLALTTYPFFVAGSSAPSVTGSVTETRVTCTDSDSIEMPITSRLTVRL